jgi:hypothetical protein
VPDEEAQKMILTGRDLVTLEMCELVGALIAQGVSSPAVDCVYIAVVDHIWTTPTTA